MQSKFEERLNQIITSEQSDEINAALDEIEHERPPLPTSIEYEEVKSVVVADGSQPSDKIDDYLFARKIMYGVINRGTVALENALLVARETEHPRAYEVSATIMKNLTEMTKSLLELQDVINGGGGSKGGGNTISKQINIQNNYGSADNSPKDINALLDGLDIEIESDKDE